MDELSRQTWRDRLASLDAEGREDEALRFLQIEAFQNPEDGEVAFLLGERLKARGLNADAALVFALVSRMEGHPLRFRGLLERAECLRAMGDVRSAETTLREAMALDPGSHWPVQAMAEIFAATGRDAERVPLIEAHYEALRADGRAAIARYVSGMLAYWHFNETRSQPGWRPHLPARVPGLARAGAVMLVKDEEDIIGQSLTHHYALGFRSFCILNNKSTDKTRATIEVFRDSHGDCFILLIDDPVVGHYQGSKMEIYSDTFVRHARLGAIDLEWLFFLDADEFISAGSTDEAGAEIGRFDAILTDPDAQLLVLHWIHASSSAVLEGFVADQNPFEVFNRFCARLLPVVPKIGYRVGSGLKPMEGNHFVARFDGPLGAVRTLALDDWYLYHFSLRSLDQVRKKIINGGKAFQEAKGLEDHGLHWRDRFSLFEKHGEIIVHEVIKNYVLEVTGHTIAAGDKHTTSPENGSVDIVGIDIDSACREFPEFDCVRLAESWFGDRPGPDFIYGNFDTDTVNEFTRENAVWPVSVYTLRNVDILGPWFEIGSVIIKDKFSISCQEIYLDGKSEKATEKILKYQNSIREDAVTCVEIIDPCILLATNGHQIYGHWLVDFLPKLYLLHKIDIDISIVKILLPSNTGAFARDLLFCCGIKEEQIVSCDPDRVVIRAHQLIVPTLLRMSGRASTLFKEAVDFINELINKNNDIRHSAFDKIFISRDELNSWRPLVNSETIESIARKAGFYVMHPEKLSVIEQISVFRGAKFIAGENGSGLHNSIFNRSRATVCSIHGNRSGWFAGLQSGIGEQLQQRTGYVFGAVSEVDGRFPIYVNENDFIRCLDEQFSI